ncbi:NAD(P)H-hydrate dehydratase [Aurantiacibacter sp. MUD61]|uniref:NAD(P)H-hydrate dehydratase n=1 Tax=Aurantiacibacter sp. MUD61 TaxID=3009083 RepID=UPI0022EFFCD7|nr:NAD(P)H-hydrate dehydratase [Aurantiacibacter sp. MUD61]
MRAPEQILTAEQMQAAEQRLIDGGTTVESLMETAGAGAAEYVYRACGTRSVTVLCGPGNNGGDGYVIARHLQTRGVEVQVVAPLDPATDAAKAARAAWGGNPVESASGAVFVDCLFGTGLGRPLDDDLLGLLHELADAHEYRIAVDLPSGVDSDSGELLNDTLPEYDCTIALGAWKFSHWLMPAMDQMGTRKLVDIGVEAVSSAAHLSRAPQLTAPPRDAHKYSRGLLCVIAGDMPGASVLAASAARHGGAGYVKILAAEDSQYFTAPHDVVIERGSLYDLVSDRRIDAFLIGPGLGLSDQARARLDWVLACDIPTVCDADALTLLEPSMIEGRDCPIIATPHAGELDRLANAFEATGMDRVEMISELAEDIEGVLVAKGPDTLIGSAGSAPVIMPPAPSWLSTAGTGDILAGLIASRLATGVYSRKAAEQGCWLHREAARIAAPAFSADQLVEAVPAAYSAFL